MAKTIQYGEAKLIPFMYIKGINFASPYCRRDQGNRSSLLRSKLNSTKTQLLSSGNIVIIHMTCWSKVTLKSLLKSQTSNKAYGTDVRRK